MSRMSPVMFATALLLSYGTESFAGERPALIRTLPLGNRVSSTSARPARVSANGTHVVFSSHRPLAPGDRNGRADIYVLELSTGVTTYETVGISGHGSGDSTSPDISADGRLVVFESTATNLVDLALAPGPSRVYLRDRSTGMTRLLSTTATGAPAGGSSRCPRISADGSTVIFESDAVDLLTMGNAFPGQVNVYAIRLDSDRRLRIGVATGGEERSGLSISGSLSSDGRYVAFMSRANLTCRSVDRAASKNVCLSENADRNGVADVYLHDTHTSTTTRVSRAANGGDANGASYYPAISGDGRIVAFVSEASNLTRKNRGAHDHLPHVYWHELAAGNTERVSETRGRRSANGPSALQPAVSYDGSTLAFQSLATDLLCERRCPAGLEDTNLVSDVFIWARGTGITQRVSADGGDEWMQASGAPDLDGSGRVIVFVSRHHAPGADGRDEVLYIRHAVDSPAHAETTLR